MTEMLLSGKEGGMIQMEIQPFPEEAGVERNPLLLFRSGIPKF